MQLEVLDCNPGKGCLFVKIRHPDGLILHSIKVTASKGHPWVETPTRPILDRDGKQKLGVRDGDPLSAPTITFDSAAVGSAFSKAVLAAVRSVYPTLLNELGIINP